jgi:membrane-bound serine protease (ClpP class)
MYFACTLALTGLFLIFLEFFLPGAIMAIGGGLLLLISLFFFHMSDPRPFSLFVYAVSLLSATLLVVRIALWKIKASKKGIISDGSQEGFQASIYPKELIGKTGVAATDLKPSGHVWIGDRNFEALSKSGYIDKGTQIQVLSGQGSHLLVKLFNEETKL